MKIPLFLAGLAALAGTVLTLPGPAVPGALPLVRSNQLRRVLLRSNLLAKANVLQGFADATPEKNRLVGGAGHIATVDYLYNTLAALDYYDVQRQEFTVLISEGSANFTVGGKSQGAQLMTFSTSGAVSKELVPVSNLGCNATDYPAAVAGKIALISRGTCPFGQKSALAGGAGAAGAVIYNNVEGAALSGTLGAPPRPEGPYVPTVGISLANGTALLTAITGGQTIIGDLSVRTTTENRTTHNVIAETKGGDHNNVYQLGGHTDSVAAGPGINDDGSGILALLEIAIQLTKFSVNNAIRFSFWAAEEIGLLGSNYYVSQLSAEEIAKIRIYLNFDMIASPNYIYAVYDGDGSAFNVSGPPGSAQGENLLVTYLNSVGLKTVPTKFDGRSDYQAFINAGMPSSGLFTGAEGIKTVEEQALFAGQAGVAYDVNYHGAGDTVKNLNMDAWIQNSKVGHCPLGGHLRSQLRFPTAQDFTQ
ncbi:MAG: hypothetical protein Q9187_007173, partial [Circinaria calcarea]